MITDGTIQIWQLKDPRFDETMHNLTLEHVQIIALLYENKATLATMPQHLQEVYDAIMPDVLKSLLEQ